MITQTAVITENETPRRRFHFALAENRQQIEACQQLRYRVFADEFGAKIDSDLPGLDADDFDAHCHHLMIIDSNSNDIIATTRLMTRQGAAAAGSFYSESEFELDNILDLSGELLEVGRTCIANGYRNGVALATLWQGVAHFAITNKIDYLMGCASIPFEFGVDYVFSVLKHIRERHEAPVELRVTSRNPIPQEMLQSANGIEAIIPTLLKGYLKQGAYVCSDPFYDTDFNCADVFVLLSRNNLASRYIRHFNVTE